MFAQPGCCTEHSRPHSDDPSLRLYWGFRRNGKAVFLGSVSVVFSSCSNWKPNGWEASTCENVAYYWVVHRGYSITDVISKFKTLLYIKKLLILMLSRGNWISSAGRALLISCHWSDSFLRQKSLAKVFACFVRKHACTLCLPQTCMYFPAQ